MLSYNCNATPFSKFDITDMMLHIQGMLQLKVIFIWSLSTVDLREEILFLKWKPWMYQKNFTGTVDVFLNNKLSELWTSHSHILSLIWIHMNNNLNAFNCISDNIYFCWGQSHFRTSNESYESPDLAQSGETHDSKDSWRSKSRNLIFLLITLLFCSSSSFLQTSWLKSFTLRKIVSLSIEWARSGSECCILILTLTYEEDLFLKQSSISLLSNTKVSVNASIKWRWWDIAHNGERAYSRWQCFIIIY